MSNKSVVQVHLNRVLHRRGRVEVPDGVVRAEPVTREWADALAEGDSVVAQRFGIVVEPGWIVFPEALTLLIDWGRGPVPAQWGPHLIFDEDGALVGSGGWKGAPVDGVAELGYAVAPSRRGRGIATAVVNQLLSRARAAGLRMATAHTLAEESASTAVLRRCGFANVGELVDPGERPVWRWELML